MIIPQVPELADGGYWYVTQLKPDVEGFEPDIETKGWCAWYGEINDVTWVAVRTHAPVPNVPTADPVTVQAVLDTMELSKKPFGRIGGL